VKPTTGKSTTLKPAVGVCGLVAALLIRLPLTGEHRRFVRSGMGPLLLIAGIVLSALTLVALLRSDPTSDETDDDDRDHAAHHQRAGVGWLLLVPVLVLFVIAPPSLGAWGVANAGRITHRKGSNYPPIAAGHGPSVMAIKDVYGRAVEGDGASFNRQAVLVRGFVVPAPKGQTGFMVARYSIACCAADALVAELRVLGPQSVPHQSTWVEVVGIYAGLDRGIPQLRATSVKVIPVPNEPFE